MGQINSIRFEEHFRDQKMIDEGLLEIDQNKREEKLKKLIESMFELANYDHDRTFKILSYIVSNNEFQLEEYELRQVVEKLYQLTEDSWYEYGEETGLKKDYAYTLDRWEKIYNITGIGPSKDFTLSDITSYPGVVNILNNPDRIAFDLYKDDQVKLEELKQNPKLLEPEVFSHDVLLEKYSPEQIRKILFDVILYQKTDNLSSNVYFIKEIKRLLPEFEFVLEKEKAKEFYEAFIFEYLNKNAENSYCSNHLPIVNFQNIFQDIFEAIGVPIDQISFDKKNIDRWYLLLGEFWKNYSSNNSLFSSYLEIIPEFEKITHVPFDFSKYSEDIALCYENEVHKLQRNHEVCKENSDSWEYYNLKNSPGSYILDFHHEIERVEKLTGQKATAFESVPFQQIYKEELQRLKSIFIELFKSLDSVSLNNFIILNDSIRELQERSGGKLIFSEEEIHSMNDSVKRWCRYSNSLSSEEDIKKFESFASALEFITALPFRVLVEQNNFEAEYRWVLFSLENIDSIDKFLHIVFDEQDIRGYVVDLVMYKFDNELFSFGLEIMSHFGIRKEDLFFTETEYLKTNLEKIIERNLDAASQFIKVFEVSEPFVKEIVLQSMCRCLGTLSSNLFEKALKIEQHFHISNEDFHKFAGQDLSKSIILSKFNQNLFAVGFEIMSHFGIRKEDIFSPESDELKTQLERVMKADLSLASQFIKLFEVSELIVKEIAIKVIYNEITTTTKEYPFLKILEIKQYFKIQKHEFLGVVDVMFVDNIIFNFKSEIFDQALENFIPPEFFETDSFKRYIREKLLKDPRKVVQVFEKNEVLLNIVKKDIWCSGFLQIKKLQNISQNEKNDPWQLELVPLFFFATWNRLIDINKDKDIELIVEYIKRYGMCNLKTVFSLYVACTRANSWSDIPQQMIAECEEYGIRVRKQNEEGSWRFAHPKLVLNELDKSLAVFQNELMSDNIPENINSEIGREQFSRMLGTTQWGRGDSVTFLVNTWKKTLETEPSAALLPKGYQESTFVCNEISRSVFTVTEQQNVDQKLRELFQSKEVQEIYTPLVEALIVGLDANVSEEYWKTKQDEIFFSLQQKIDEVDKFLKASPEQFDLWIEEEKDEKLKTSLLGKKKALLNERGRIGIEKQKFQLFEILEKMKNISFIFENEEDIVKTLEKLAPMVDTVTGVAVLFREISALHLVRTMAHLNWGRSLKEIFASGIEPTSEKISNLNSFLKQYVREHYLQKEQNQEHTGHIPFSDVLCLSLERIWKVQESRKGNIPLDGIQTKVDKIINPNGEESLKQVEVSMVPVAGLLRIYAGDIGDACYTSQHLSLAQNKFPGLHAWIYVTKRGTQQETLCGSMLGIQTVQQSGVPTLIARANNPKENFIQGVDSETFVIASLKAVIETAKRIRLVRIEDARKQGVKEVEKRQCVVIPIDPVTASSTNRQKVGATYLRFHALPKVELRNQPETNFNGYQNWNKSGNRACSVIWEIDENGNEKYYGRWPE